MVLNQKIGKNAFLILSLLLFFSFVISGYILITAIYKAEPPIYKEDLINFVDLPVSINLSCETETEIPVSGDVFTCKFRSYGNQYRERFYEPPLTLNYSWKDYSYFLNYSTGPLHSYIDNPLNPQACFKGQVPLIPVTCDLDVPIPIKGPGTNFLIFEITLKNEKTGEVEKIPPLLNFFVYKSISQEEYNKRQYEKIALLIALISLSLTVSFSTIRNLMEIWDRKYR